MNVVREQKSAARSAERSAVSVKVPVERPGPPLAISTYHAVEAEAAYGCVDWYQYGIQAEGKEIRH